MSDTPETDEARVNTTGRGLMIPIKVSKNLERQRDQARRDCLALLGLIADIRAGIGDPTGKLMQDELIQRCVRMRVALEQLRDCDWVITLPERMDGVRKIAREALQDPKA